MLSFQSSSHARRWIVSPARVQCSNEVDLRFFSRAELFAVKANYVAVLQALGRQLRLRQTVVATAAAFFWRFCLRHSFSTSPDCHPDWLAPTCLSLACKVEECPLPATEVLQAAIASVAKMPSLHYGTSADQTFMSRVMKNEFVLMQALNSELIVFHPYNDLLTFIADFASHAATPLDSEQIGSLTLLAWNIINDSLRCEACLLFAPYDIALAALFMAIEKQQIQGETSWWVQLQHDLLPVKKAVSYILTHA